MTTQMQIKDMLQQVLRRLDRIEATLETGEGQVGSRRAAEILGCTVQALQKRVARGQVPCTKQGKRLKFDSARLVEMKNQFINI